ncbi:hypothetical protein GYMLUDRAFT_247329 [Collybiopsis luxurians FD-317 M1]|uniref:Protein kinase domain-containing protein n=1 Tax=Collybiopsis luxurians FD-317 M1 TaxID=944289 RepID=A0A0D0CP63_9AGAR|nr:hypothetical protein GYMLUDRAFT_247329 [Collybiopsis luxurians FD-317 M1]
MSPPTYPPSSSSFSPLPQASPTTWSTMRALAQISSPSSSKEMPSVISPMCKRSKDNKDPTSNDKPDISQNPEKDKKKKGQKDKAKAQSKGSLSCSGRSSKKGSGRGTNRQGKNGMGGGRGRKWSAATPQNTQQKCTRHPSGPPIQTKVVIDELEEYSYIANFESVHSSHAVILNPTLNDLQHGGKMLLCAKKRCSFYVIKYGQRSATKMSFFLKRLNHPNIIAPKKMFIWDGFTCALLPVYTVLSKLLTYRSQLASQFYSMSHNLACGVQFLHLNGVAHMDIKPDNLIFDASFKLIIINFDLSLSFRDEEQMNNNKWQGTDFWMAPGSFFFFFAVLPFWT